MNDTVSEMWQDFVASGIPAEGSTYTSWYFGTPGPMADELVELVLAGPKRATAGSLWVYEREGEALPRPGDYSVITDGSEVARCIIRTTRVDVVPFGEVSEEFAATEGEGDGSLGYWREGHWRYFSRELAGFGLEATQDMPVVCERFEVVWPR